MFDKIIAFFKRLFGGLGGRKTPEPTPVKKEVPDELPKPAPDLPVDASEIKADTAATVVVVSDDEPVKLEPGDDPAGPKPEDFSEPEPSPTSGEPEPEDAPGPGEPVHEHNQRYLWCLDNGHGSKTIGKRSPRMDDGRQLLEYEFNRDIVNKIIQQLKELDIAYYNVVPEVDTDNFLEGRVSRANSKESELPKIFVSVHSNASGSGSEWMPASGIETWHFHGSRTGQAIAKVFQKHLIAQTGWKNRKLKSYPGKRQFYVLRNTNMPAVLTENGFYDNKEECKQLMKPEIRQKIANAHVAAILEIEKNGI